MGDFVPSRAFLFFILVPREGSPEKRRFSLNASKMCFAGECVPLGSFCFGVKSSQF